MGLLNISDTINSSTFPYDFDRMVQQISILNHFLKDEKPKCQTLNFNSEMREGRVRYIYCRKQLLKK